MKQFIRITIFLLAFVLPSTALAYDFKVDGIYYRIINDNEVSVTYKAFENNQYISDYSGNVTIPATITYNGTTYTVTRIGGFAFYLCGNLTSILIPNSVTEIGSSAFFLCTKLTEIIIPNSVISINYQAFYGCERLTNLNIPNSVTGIGQWAFSFCKGLKSISIGKSVTSIGDGVFAGCTNLTSITVDNENLIFDSRNNCNAIIETSTNKLIAGCGSTILPNNLEAIGNRAFYSCTNLMTVTIPNTVTSIGSLAFQDCIGLTSIHIPKSITSIGERAFSSCTGLTDITVANDNLNYDSRNNCNAIIETSTNKLIAGCKNTIIPNTVTAIGDYTFYGCSGLTKINIPNSVISIGEWAFYGTSINHAAIPNSVVSIGGYAFRSCFSLSSIEIGNSVTSIGIEAFSFSSRINNIYCYTTTPPSCGDNLFYNYMATLHVPASSLATYFTAPVWCNFENIVGDAIAPTGISVNKDSVEMQLGEQLQLTATVTPANASNKDVTWFSTNCNVVTIDNGTVMAVDYGECDIIAYCFGMQAICHISVGNKITLDQQEAMLLPNHMLILTPSTLSGLTATSSDPTVAAARVMNGKVQVVGIKEGTTTITVGSTDGAAVPATCLVTVYTESGDVNCDGFIDINDVTGLIDYVLTGNIANLKAANADFNNDSFIDIDDITALIDHVLGK